MANFKRKNKSHRAQVKKLDPCNNWSTPKSIQRATKENKNFITFVGAHCDDSNLVIIEKMAQ